MKVSLSFTHFAFLGSALVAFVLGQGLSRQYWRTPSDMGQGFTLELQKMELGSEVTVVEELKDVYISVIFENNKKIETIDFFKGSPLHIRKGEQIDLSLKVPVTQAMIENDELNFRIEIKRPRGILSDDVLVRCGYISKRLSEYNRNYTCTLPKNTIADIKHSIQKNEVAQLEESTPKTLEKPFLVYRLFRNDRPTLAQQR